MGLPSEIERRVERQNLNQLNMALAQLRRRTRRDQLNSNYSTPSQYGNKMVLFSVMDWITTLGFLSVFVTTSSIFAVAYLKGIPPFGDPIPLRFQVNSLVVSLPSGTWCLDMNITSILDSKTTTNVHSIEATSTMLFQENQLFAATTVLQDDERGKNNPVLVLKQKESKVLHLKLSNSAFDRREMFSRMGRERRVVRFGLRAKVAFSYQLLGYPTVSYTMYTSCNCKDLVVHFEPLQGAGTDRFLSD